MIVKVDIIDKPGSEPRSHWFSRVPCVGECVAIGDGIFEVTSVLHIAGTGESQCCAVIHVKTRKGGK